MLARFEYLNRIAAGKQPHARAPCTPEATAAKVGVEPVEATQAPDATTARLPERDQYGDLRDAPNMTLAEARVFLTRGNLLHHLGMWKLELELRDREHEVTAREKKVAAREWEVDRREQALKVQE